MFNNRGGWTDRGNWRGHNGPQGNNGRGNIGNAHGRGFRGSYSRGNFKSGRTGFGGPNRRVHGRGSFYGSSKSRDRNYSRDGLNDRSINYSAGDQSLYHFTGEKVEDPYITQNQLPRMSDTNLNQSSIHVERSNVNEAANFSNTSKEIINQSPDISSSTTSPIKQSQPDHSSSEIADIKEKIQTVPLNPSRNSHMEIMTNSSKSIVLKCEPCDVGIVGEAVSCTC